MGKTGKRSKHHRGNRNQPRSSRNPVAPTNPWTGRGPRAQRLESPSRAKRRRDERSRSPRPKAGTSQQTAPTGESSSKEFPTAPPRGPRDWRMDTQHSRAQATNGHPGSQPRETNPPAPFLRQDPNGQSLLTARRGGTQSGNHRNGTPRVNVANSSRRTTDSFEPRDEHDALGSKGRPIVLGDPEPSSQSYEKFNSLAQKAAERESVHGLGESASVAAVTHAGAEGYEASMAQDKHRPHY